MTVASLWTVLDRADCGTAVGARELIDPNATHNLNDPWNWDQVHQRSSSSPENRTTLAVDLSIWICEGLTSTALSTNHANPAVYLVYTRTLRLLQMGIKLIVVVEGKRRIRRSPEEGDLFRKRRSGTAFWKACKECEDMLQNLGVPVVRATAEGEALCAILNQRGIVDGVISNDGDCLLFGAQVVYTRFSIDNLDKGLVVKYEASNLRGLVDDSNKEQDGVPPNDSDGVTRNEPESTSSVSLSREDLIAFALLTGSDLAGDGLPKVGHKKAIRFIRKCKENFPLNPDTAAIDELKSWARCAAGTAATNDTTKGRCCSNCSHPGDKRSHEKHGCEECGTAPGEPCLRVTIEDKFRDSLRAKALAMQPKFDATQVLNAYMMPNNNQVPASLVGETARSICMGYPQLANMLQLPFIVKGIAMHASRDYIKQSLVRLLARRTLFDQTKQTSSEKQGGRIRLSRERPVPIEISRRLVQNQVTCFEITWSVSATMTDNDGNGVDGYIFSTIEDKQLVEEKYPDLVQAFLEAEKEKEKQGDAEVQRRRSFVLKILDPRDAVAANNDENARQQGRKRKNKRGDFFERKRARVDHHGTRRHDNSGGVRGTGEDAKKLILFARVAARKGADMLVESIEDSDTVATEDSISTKEELPKKHKAFVGRPPRGRLAAKMQLEVDDKHHNAPIPSVIAIPARFLAKVRPAARKLPDEPAMPPTPSPQDRRPRKTRYLIKGTILPQKLFDGPSPPLGDPVEQLPVLTPGNIHTVTCDMGIHITVTPLVSRRRRRRLFRR